MCRGTEECLKINRLWEPLIRSGKYSEINLSLECNRYAMLESGLKQGLSRESGTRVRRA
jgi:hypothetical protein